MQFWKNIAFSSPLYAADVPMTLMDAGSGSWNLNSLDSVLTAGMKFPLPGVNTPYCYFGSWKSFFCWHTEDMDLAAINFLHAGKTKYWYAVRPADRDVVEEEARLEFPARFEKCHEHIRHKTTVINPYKLKAKHPKLHIHKYFRLHLDKSRTRASSSWPSAAPTTAASTRASTSPKPSTTPTSPGWV